jgi:hypothetical protein
MDEANQTIEADTTTTTTPADKSETGDKTTTSVPADTKSGTGGAAGKSETKTIASGADAEEDDAAREAKAAADHKPAWPDDWREKLAQHMSAGDKAVYKKELARLQRIADPAGVYGMYRELEGKFTSGGLIKVPGKDAKPEDVAAFHKALGVPEKPEDYFKDIKLDNGAVIGELDKPLVQSIAGELHKVGATPAVLSTMLNWYYKQQEDQAARLDEMDDTFRRETERALKDDLGPAFKRQTNAIASLFATAPGGTDVNNESGLFSRLMAGRMADGKIIGNDPDMVRFLISLVSEVNPAATVVEDGNQTGQSIETEIAAIEKDMRENRRAYFKDEAKQARYRELISARDKIRARG